MEKQKNDTTLRNILILSVSFMLLMAAWLTTAAISSSIVQSAKADDPSVTVDSFLALCIVNGAFAISSFIAPAVVTVIGVKEILVVGSALYGPFVASFIHPEPWLVYSSAAVLGFAASLVWVANGCCFAFFCTKDNIGKYLGIWWTIMALGQLFGSGFVFWKFQGSNHIDYDTRLLVMAVLAIMCIGCSITLLFLDSPKKKSDGKAAVALEMKQSGFCTTLIEPFRLLTNKHMLLLVPPSFMNGLEIAMFSSLFPTAVGFTEAFGGDTRKLVGVAGILIGLGSLLGGLILGAFGEKTIKSNRSLAVLIACITYCLACFLTFINHPNSSSLGPTTEVSWINPPLVPISMVSAFLLGFGDGALSPQMTAAIGVIWSENPSAALAMYRFFQAGFCSLGFFFGTLTGLYYQLMIFVAFCIFGTISFAVNEVLIARKFEEAGGSVTQIQVLSKKMSYTITEADLKCKEK